MSDAPDPAARELPDLDAVQAKIDEAHQAEDHLVHVDRGAVDPEAYQSDDDPEVVQTEGGAKETDETEGIDRS